MITQFFIDLGCNIAAWFAGLIPSITPPSWFVGLGDQINSVISQLNGVGVWVDWSLVLGVVVAVLAVWLACALIKFGRAAASYVPFFGGAG